MILLIACDRHYAIGYKGEMLFHIPADLRHFKETTTGNIVVMGRKTLDSLPGGKPLPERLNIVLTRGEREESETLRVVHSPEELKALLEEINAEETRKVFHVGGGGLVKTLWSEIDEAIITHYDEEYPHADTWIPNLEKSPEFTMVEELGEGEYKGKRWVIRHYQRVQGKDIEHGKGQELHPSHRA